MFSKITKDSIWVLACVGFLFSNSFSSEETRHTVDLRKQYEGDFREFLGETITVTGFARMPHNIVLVFDDSFEAPRLYVKDLSFADVIRREGMSDCLNGYISITGAIYEEEPGLYWMEKVVNIQGAIEDQEGCNLIVD